ncbi:MAG: T9SS type A sorting domain-containing protein [Melioribacteraceae bacterium]|nr:T9SS type A sorting domain-containing protein [Melioribacteraceae bacterium]
MQKLIFFFLIFAGIYAQTPELIGPPGGLVFANQLKIHPTNTNLLYSGTYYGALFEFENDKNILNPIETYNQQIPLSDISFPYKIHETIFIQAGYSYRTFNKGDRWELIEPTSWNTNFIFNHMNSNAVYMTRRGNEIWRSNNLGASWNKLFTYQREDSTIIENNITAFSISKMDTSVMYFGTKSAELFRSTNSGNNWILVNNPSEFNQMITFIEPAPFDDNILYLNLHGALAKYELDSKTLKYLFDEPGKALSDYSINPQDTLIMYVAVWGLETATDLGIYKSTDGGESWERKVNGIDADFILGQSIEINPENPNELYAGIGSLGIYTTVNGGEDWTLTNAANSDVISIHIDNENPGTLLTAQLGWASMKTTNYGEDWYHPDFDNSFQYQNIQGIEINPFNTNEGFLISKDHLFKTTDKGESWNEFPQNLEGLLLISYHPDIPDLMYASSADSPIFEPGIDATYRSTDHGETWQHINNKQLISIGYDLVNEIIYGLGEPGENSILLRTTDYGESWETVLTVNDIAGYDWLWPTSLAVSNINPNHIYVAFKEGILLFSDDAGMSWSRIDNTLKELDKFSPFAEIWLDDTKLGRFYVGISGGGQPTTENFTNGGLYLTEDNGNSWRKVYGSAVNVIKADNQTPRNMYIGTKFGVKTFVDTLTVTSVRNDEEEILPNEYALFQNYPNPFNPSTQIKYAVPNATNIKLKVYDILGKEIITLVNGYKNVGTYEVQFDASNLSSGVYLYRLETESFSQTKKLMIIK